MAVRIRTFTQRDLDAVVALSLRAWEPTFASTKRVLGAVLDDALHGEWRAYQTHAVTATCTSDELEVVVADADGAIAGFCAVGLSPDNRLGVIDMLAVDPPFQRQGVGRSLINWAIAWITAQGVEVAMVETGGDPGHAPARAAYEDAGFTKLPVARYFLKL